MQAYFPKGSVWYDFYTLKKISSGGETLKLDTPIDHIQVGVAYHTNIHYIVHVLVATCTWW